MIRSDQRYAGSAFSVQTDTLFQEYFQTVPETIFELPGYTPLCRYRFESPVVKASERRLDGFLEPNDASCPYFFVELQGYHERGFYWRFVQEIARYHQMRPELDGRNWQAILLLLDKAYDPGLETLGPLYNQNDSWIIRASIPDLLARRAQLCAAERLAPVDRAGCSGSGGKGRWLGCLYRAGPRSGWETT